MNKEKLIVCRCEEVTEEEILAAIRMGAETIAAVKKLTRAGMGDCQGRTCQRKVAAFLAAELQAGMGELPEDTARFPAWPVEIASLGKEKRTGSGMFPAKDG